MTGLEIDFIVPDCKEALPLYESIFEVERIEVTDFPKGNNEAVFRIYGSRFHLLDENVELQMIAPKPGDPKPIWFNVLVPKIKDTYHSAIKAGCTEIMPLTEMESHGSITAMFADPLGYIWQLHEIIQEVSFEERNKMYEAQMQSQQR